MKNRLTILTIFCLFSGITLSAQTPDDYIDKFFKEYIAEGPKVSIDNLYTTNNWLDSQSDQVINLINQLSNVNEALVGKYRGKELITRKSLGKSFVLISYMVKYDRQPLRFTFEFYKPVNDWIIYSFKFDDTMDDELEKAAEIQELEKARGTH